MIRLVAGLLGAVYCFCVMPVAQADEFRLGVLHGNLAVFDYEISVLRLALEHAPGDHTVTVVPLPGMTQKRILATMNRRDRPIDVFVTGYTQERERDFQQVDIPITRGLLGHRIFVIRRADLERVAAVRSLNDLRERMVIGSGIDWLDTAVFEHAGFKVQTGLYENLWKMLAYGRYDAFNRGIHEAYVEIDQRREKFPALVIDDNLMVVYPFDYFFYLPKSDQRRHDIVKAGLEAAYEIGAFMAHFTSHPMIRKVIADARPTKRLTFRLDNPLLSERVRAIPEKYWHQF